MTRRDQFDLEADQKLGRGEVVLYTVMLTIGIGIVLGGIIFGIIVLVNATKSGQNVSQAASFTNKLAAPAGCHQAHRAETSSSADTGSADSLTITYTCNNLLGSTLYSELTGLIRTAGYQVSEDDSVSPNDGEYSYALAFDNGTIGGLYAVSDSLNSSQSSLAGGHYSTVTLTASPLTVEHTH